MQDVLSPKFEIDLSKKLASRLRELFGDDAEAIIAYLNKWREKPFLGISEFGIIIDDYNNLDLTATVYTIKGEKLVKMALDLDIDVPGFIPCVPQFKVDLKPQYTRAHDNFSNAWKKAQTEPDVAIGFANSTLESLMKEIIKEIDATAYNSRATTSDLIKTLLTKFKMLSSSELPNEIKVIAQNFVSACTAIDDLRSSKTNVHGKTKDDYLIDDSLYAFFTVNAVATVGSFLKSYYEAKYKPSVPQPTITS